MRACGRCTVYAHVLPSHLPVTVTACECYLQAQNTLYVEVNVAHTDQCLPGLHKGHSDSIHSDVEFSQVGHSSHSSLLILCLH